MASSLATSGIENGGLGSYAASLVGHLILAGAILFLPSREKQIYVDEVPRSVKLVAALETPPKPKPKPKPPPVKAAPEPPPAPVPKPAPAPPPSPRPKPRPKLVRPVPVIPGRALSKIQIPVKKAPTAIKSRPTAPTVDPLRDKITSAMSALDRRPVVTAPSALPRLAMPKPAPSPVPKIVASLPETDRLEDLVPLSDFPYSWYITLVRTEVERWKPPSSFSLGGRKTTAVVTLRITREGKLSRIAFRRRSGHRYFDLSVDEHLRSITSLPPLPKEYKEEHLDVEIRFSNEDR